VKKAGAVESPFEKRSFPPPPSEVEAPKAEKSAPKSQRSQPTSVNLRSRHKAQTSLTSPAPSKPQRQKKAPQTFKKSLTTKCMTNFCAPEIKTLKSESSPKKVENIFYPAEIYFLTCKYE
jgi:hypothetical protein